MSGQAQVTSVEALDAFRSYLIVYLSQMRPTIDEAGSEVVRMRHWLQVEQRQHWEQQLRQRRRKLEEAQAEAFNAKLSAFQTSSTVHNMAVEKCRRAVEEAEQKLGRIKRWERELDTLVDPLLKQVEQLQGYLTTDMDKAVMYLMQAIKALEAYTDVLAGGPPLTPPGSEAPKETS